MTRVATLLETCSALAHLLSTTLVVLLFLNLQKGHESERRKALMAEAKRRVAEQRAREREERERAQRADA